MKQIITLVYMSKPFEEPELITSVVCEEPFTEVHLVGGELMLPDEYEVEINGQSKTLRIDKDPLDYVLYMYQYFRGDYIWAKLPELYEDGHLVKDKE